MRQDQRGVAGERTQHMCGGLIVQMVETAPQRFAIQRNGPPNVPSGPLVEVTRVAAKDSFQIGWVEGEEEVA